MKSELDILREQKEDYETTIQSLESEIEGLKDELWKKENKIEGLETEISDLEDKDIDLSTIDKLMMFEKLKENWHLLKMEDIQAICKL